MAARLGVALVTTLLLLAGTAQAQQYQRLHVRAFTLTTDTARPQLEQPFHVSVTIRVAENVAHIANVFLPTFFGAEELGDEQQTTQGPDGTTYRETLTLVAHTRGMLSISSAYLDAVDARDGKAKRFISNSLRIPVGGGPIYAVWDTLRTILYVVIAIAAAGAAIFVVTVIFWRRRARPVPAPASPRPPPPLMAPSENDPARSLAGAFAQLRERRDRGAVLRLRGALWQAAGASSGETLGDVLRRPAAADEHLRRLLMVVERAAFIEQARLSQAVDDVLSEREWTYV